ncbi:hypothetical protein BI096_gp39 [Enterobacter phage Arya]|uniref:AP2/ERF domain-containing protein n=1 Tax=Enterobacter phage Arya TaxID=1864622 RepID=A0A193GYS4_9CAUD|nr:hypothetical protein BI096_gp39 [Enterobacter phage Arya]ANN86166.1 hypothetical protein BI096_gp39 [Enterobacter phage Arya]
MSLAGDILRRLNLPVTIQESPAPQPQPQPKPEPTLLDKKHIKWNCAQREFYGVTFSKRKQKWQARITTPKGKIVLGYFRKRQRAAIAVQLYLLWFRRGFIDIPTGKYLTE